MSSFQHHLPLRLRDLSLPWLTPASLWLVLAATQAVISVVLVQGSQHVPLNTLLAVVVWCGSLICLEGRLASRPPRPNLWGACFATLLLLFSLWRSLVTVDLDTMVYVLPLLQGLALALLWVPPRRLGHFRDPLLVLLGLPMALLLMRLLPEWWISRLGARLAQALLLLSGWDVAVQGREIAVGLAHLQVVGACNGVDLIAQLTVIALIFVLAFPLQRRQWRLAFVALAPLVALLTNAVRIALLAVVVSGSGSADQPLFVFFHDEWGSLLFAGIAMTLLGWLYYQVLDRDLRRLERHE